MRSPPETSQPSSRGPRKNTASFPIRPFHVSWLDPHRLCLKGGSSAIRNPFNFQHHPVLQRKRNWMDGRSFVVLRSPNALSPFSAPPLERTPGRVSEMSLSHIH